MTTIRIENGDQIPAEFGQLKEAVRKTTVAIREPNGEETFEKSWGKLTAVPGVDFVITQDSGDEYPIKKDIFADTYQEVEPGRYRKTARSRLVQIPEGVTAVLGTKEGDITVEHPDYLVVGAANEVYANKPDWIEANLEFVS